MKHKKMTSENFIEKVESSFEDVEKTLWHEGQERGKLFMGLKVQALERERKRRLAAHGKDDPVIKKIDARIASNAIMTEHFVRMVDDSRVREPKIDANTSMVHGRVYLGKDTGPVRITLRDTGGKVIPKAGAACLKKNGYYSIKHRPGDEDRFSIYVTDERDRVLLNEPLQLRKGAIVHRNLDLRGDDQTCHEPDTGGGPGSDEWVARGCVRDKSGKGIGGLRVLLYDKDLFLDDPLGEDVTDKEGNFKIIYHTGDFRAEGLAGYFEKNPDLYIRILDRDGKERYSSKGRARKEAGRVEEFDITI